MKKILFPLLMILFVVGGAVAADFFRGSDKPADAAEHSSGKADPSKKSSDKKDKGHDSAKENVSTDVSYLKFKRQFVVPVMDHGKITALVIMNLNLELNSDAPENVYSQEPKLRDAITRELLALSNDDVFGENLTSAESYETLRSTLLRAAKGVLPEGIQDVLILDIARQEQ